jgi:hypothetical protein
VEDRRKAEGNLRADRRITRRIEWVGYVARMPMTVQANKTKLMPFVRFEVFTAVTMKNVDFWNI